MEANKSHSLASPLSADIFVGCNRWRESKAVRARSVLYSKMRAHYLLW